MERYKTEVITTGYKPRPLQAELHSELKRFNVLVCHRRFGKTVFSLNEMIDKAVRNNLHNPQYAYIAPTYKQAKIIAWEYFQDYTKSIPGYEANKSELTVYLYRPGEKKNGKWVKKPDKIKFMLLGADNPDALRGLYLDGAIIDEFAQCDPIIWGEIIRPALTDRGGWAIFIGTPKGQNHFYHRYEMASQNPSWYVAVHRASKTGIISKEELEDMKNDMDDSEYEQEMECSFSAAIKGSYYGELISKAKESGRIGKYPYDPAYPVDTYWDLGIGDSLSIWFRQKLPNGFRYIKYYETNGKSLVQIAKYIKEQEYSYGRHVLPWDAKARDLGTGLTRQETLRKHGVVCEVQKRQQVDDRIHAARILLPKCYFDSEGCSLTLNKVEVGIGSLINYQKEWDSKTQMFKDKPKHDWASHGADSFGYSALDDRPSQFAEHKYDDLPRMVESEYNELEGV